MVRLTDEQRILRKLEIAAYQKEYREKNKENRKKYLTENSEKIKKQAAAWAINNADKRKQYNKEWAALNAENRAEYRDARAERTKYLNSIYNASEKAKKARDLYKKCNKEKIRESGFKYRAREESKEKARIRKHKRRALEKTGILSNNLASSLIKLQKSKCASCGIKISKKSSHLDHIIPLSKGGKNIDKNIQLLCPPCNLSKGAKHPIEFMQSRGFLC